MHVVSTFCGGINGGNPGRNRQEKASEKTERCTHFDNPTGFLAFYYKGGYSKGYWAKVDDWYCLNAGCSELSNAKQHCEKLKQ